MAWAGSFMLVLVLLLSLHVTSLLLGGFHCFTLGEKASFCLDLDFRSCVMVVVVQVLPCPWIRGLRPQSDRCRKAADCGSRQFLLFRYFILIAVMHSVSHPLV